MSQCPNCNSTDIVTSDSFVGSCMGVGAQIGSIMGCALGVGAGGLGAFVGLSVGGALGGWAGYALGKAIDPRWKSACQKCGCTWKQLV